MICVLFGRYLIHFIKDKNIPMWQGYLYAILMFVVAFVQSIILHQYFHRCFVVGMRLRTAIISAVYRKVINSNQWSTSLLRFALLR